MCYDMLKTKFPHENSPTCLYINLCESVSESLCVFVSISVYLDTSLGVTDQRGT